LENIMAHSDIRSALDSLIAVRLGGLRPARLKAKATPITLAEAYRWQDAVLARLGPVVGWKVGSDSPASEPFRAGLTAPTLHQSPARLSREGFNVIGVEAEIVYTLARPLPVQAEPYTRAEVLAAIGSVHAGIEIVDTRFAAWGIVDRASQIVDQFNHGALIIGEGRGDDFEIDPGTQMVQLDLNGETVIRKAGGNSAGDAVNLLIWLANGGASSQGGLAAGATVTTGSWTGTLFAGPGTHARASFDGIGEAVLEII
jgi:2-keto-4-pentenoate hydratase